MTTQRGKKFSTQRHYLVLIYVSKAVEGGGGGRTHPVRRQYFYSNHIPNWITGHFCRWDDKVVPMSVSCHKGAQGHGGKTSIYTSAWSGTETSPSRSGWLFSETNRVSMNRNLNGDQGRSARGDTRKISAPAGNGTPAVHSVASRFNELSW